MNAADQLRTVSNPFLTTIVNQRTIAAAAREWQDAGLLVRTIRGIKARSVAGLFDEFSAAFQFPHYFGENWSAFQDCISDLEWLPFQNGVVVLICSADEALVDAHPTELTTLVKSLATASADFAVAVTDGEWWDRAPVPFHVVLQCTREDEFGCWIEAGAALGSLM
ncbi:barstar family protein [Aestuariimicrobium sp. T2.26MG-19.2B]|uniref:barstar family protein n=1 Tax=Aestuariimicrobium sp. T2.26MG-19.2B TaxID=3040679 RepID=UPI00247795E5|nr:barstar family protein [Aestuariimicrobium sp. T2.26MG-19.2B]CAI9409274.1 hypothetical protein AESSP_02204 [Aestuariimicrobium sp. T2.26MG-19.2B]